MAEPPVNAIRKKKQSSLVIGMNMIKHQEADAIEQAVKSALRDGYRTIDIMPREGESMEGITQVGTAEMGDLICHYIKE